MFAHKDALSELSTGMPLKERVIKVHDEIRENTPEIDRVAIALFDNETRYLKTYVESNQEGKPLGSFEAKIDDSPSLRHMYENAVTRVINDLTSFDPSVKHTQSLVNEGYLSSYTKPIVSHNEFFGFLFFNSKQKNTFNQKSLRTLDVFSHLISLMVVTEISMIKIMSAALKTSGALTQLRDPETGCHLQRMSRYSRLIARNLPDHYGLTDDYIEHVFMYAPLHDLGKIAIPDHILMKPGKLDDAEMDVMKTHTTIGRQIIDEIIDNFNLEGLDDIEMVRNIAEFHHEAVDGSGYPVGMTGEEIPLESKIIAVADIFDALTSERPYKKAWTNADAFALLKKLAGVSLDNDCVDALIDNQDEVKNIQQTFHDEGMHC